MNPILWQPSNDAAAQTQIMAMARANNCADVEALRRWSLEQPAAFWRQVWELGGIKATIEPAATLLDGGKMPGAQWFAGAKLNFAENLLRRDDGQPAIIAYKEDGTRSELSWAGLVARTASLAAAFRADGVVAGDRVAALLPNCEHAIIGMLAATSIGAIWSSASPDFGASGVLDRFGQIEPKIFLSVDGYRYNGKPIDIKGKVADVSRQLPTLTRTVICPYLKDDPDLGPLEHAVTLADYAKSGTHEIEFAHLPFDHPLYILYSSGTTGKPKAIVHGAGGTLIQHIKEHRLHTDARPGEKFFYFTTCGWMMWNWLVGGLAAEETLILFDGSPFYPDAKVLWDIAEREQINVFGTSAKYIDACKKAGLRPKDTHDLGKLRALLSTGSPLVPESFDYVYDAIKSDLQLASISGGTDIVSCFVLGNPAGAVHRGEIQMRGLGMDVQIWNDAGEPVESEKGELVCTRPFPCMPVKFWNDADGSRYHSAYFDRFDNIWCHGDFAELTSTGGIIIHGRSDAVLNPGGVRIGTAEIYRQVEQLPQITEAICVGQEWEGDVRVVLFVRLSTDVTLDEELKNKIKAEIRANCTPRHVPAKIIEVADIPRTRSGKISEIAVRDVIHGRAIKNTEALANPEALSHFTNLAELA